MVYNNNPCPWAPEALAYFCTQDQVILSTWYIQFMETV